MFWFFAGIGVGGFLGWLIYLSARREAVQFDEEVQHLQQEKQMVVEFMHNMVEAVGEGVGRRELFQRIVHAAVRSTGAESACAYERTKEDDLQGVAVEGLFPPQRLLPGEGTADPASTRAKFFEQVLTA